MRPGDDPELDPELAELAELLDETARAEARDLEDVDGVSDAPGLAHHDASVEALWRDLDRERRRARWMRWSGVTAAAATIALGLFLLRDRDADHGPVGDLLGDGTLRILRPRGEVRAWDTIEWTGPGGSYSLSVLDADTSEIVFGPERVVAESYSLTAEQTAGWPAAVVIEVECRLPDGSQELDSAWAELVP